MGCWHNFKTVKRSKVCESFSLSKDSVIYWRDKTKDPLYHSGLHGGKRWEKFSVLDRLKMRTSLWMRVQVDPLTKISEHLDHLRRDGFECSREYVWVIFEDWKWSWKRPSYQQAAKYTQKNIQYYYAYLAWLSTKDLKTVKFCDEVHFVAKDVSRRRGLGPSWAAVIVIRDGKFDETYSITCLTSLDPEKKVFLSGMLLASLLSFTCLFHLII